MARDQRFRAMFELVDDAVLVTDTDGRVLDANDVTIALLGHPLDELRALTLVDLMGPLPAPLASLVQSLRDGARCMHELPLRTRSGEPVDVDLRVRLLRGEGGGEDLLVVVARDIRDRLKAERQLQESEGRHRLVAEMASDYLFRLRVTPTGVVMDYTTDNYREITGRSADDARTEDDWARFIHPDDMAVLRDSLRTILQTGLPTELECRSATRGATRWVRVLARPERDAAGRVVAIVGAVKDITESRNAKDARAALENQLQQAMKMEAVGRLAGGVAHDFNNLLTSIISNNELAMMDLTPGDPVLEMLTGVQRAAQSAASLTQQLLAFSRKQVIEPRVIDLNELITSVHRMLARLIGEDIELRLQLARPLGAVKVDKGQFEQILVNLAVNARDAMRGGGSLVIATSDAVLDEVACRARGLGAPGRYACLSVTDTGAGMSPEVLQHLFEPFFTTKAGGIGTGLGLATTYGAVKQAGGNIEATSEEGRGSRFSIHLPCVEEAAAPLEMPSGSLPRGSETILVVEDEPGVRNLTVHLLRRLGYRVIEAPGGEEALRAADGHPGTIDLLLTDVIMPRMSGREVAERLLPRRPSMKVLFTSGYTDDVISRHAVLRDGMHFLPKPFAPPALAQKIREVLGARRPS